MAVRGAGAWLGSRRLTAAAPATSLSSAVLGTGFSYDAGRRGAQGRVLAGVLPRIGNLRRLGSAALDLCFVAANKRFCESVGRSEADIVGRTDYDVYPRRLAENRHALALCGQ